VITIYGKDAAGNDCPEGYYATDGRTLYLMPPTAELVKEGAYALRLATQDEVTRLHPAQGGCRAASAEHIANCDPTPSDRKA
jgi:hypothetical protein